ncbi:hypothetical protein CHLNCDRAFT_56430 [Chlorella variabilis]|uniref:ATP-dependent RNA helicase n=1 Tax=Chlorella variabilis TaxID=554065 RepID=E1Z1W3_CHLVA|nr:hypothetical protein CHLNCDRAFT_56430 [Chlorella variabilis]EFN59565.1 hypothetical protein CHLNCDRAFT_56430 [Chlorella variabilis]|eukprot:XP_005851667.1 hypothetical protein CHLNCDRAFT_56430 [Chlorella variabilis]
MSDSDNNGLVLNLAAVPEAAGPRQSRTQQRKLKWTQQRAIKRNAHKQKFVGYKGGGSPGWLGSSRREPEPEQQAAGGGGGGGQLKGYSLDAYEPDPPAAADLAPNRQKKEEAQQQPGQRQQQRDAPCQRQQQDDPSQQQRQQLEQQQTAAGQQARQKPQPRPRQDVQQQPQQQAWQPSRRPQPPAAGQLPPGQPRSGARLAAEHLQRRQQHARGRGGSPRPSGGGGGTAAAANEDEESRRIGKLRLASRKAGYREPTPDLDEVRAAGSDADSEDVAAAVAAAVARDRAVQAELAAVQSRSRTRHERQHAAGDETGGSGGGGGGAGRVQAGGAGGTRRLAGTHDLGRFGGSSSEEEGPGAGDGVVVDFGVDYGAEEAAQRRRNKRRNKEREAVAAAAAAAAAAGGGGGGAGGGRAKAGGAAKAAWAGVRPGELVHAGGGVGEAAAQGQLFGAEPEAGGGGPSGGDGGGGGGFAALGLSRQLADHLAAHSFTQPTRVQQQAIPVLLGGRDALVNAPTGSGKTLRRAAYLAPIVHDLASHQPPITRARGTLALVICPTRELCLQVSDVLTMLVRRFVWLAERTAAFLRFARCAAGVLLCTDVAARGLDFPAVTDIVQFDPPGEAAEYVHRVGRTARLGHKGDAVLFLLPSERGYVAHLAAHGAGADLPMEGHQGAYALQKQLMEGVAADSHLSRLGGDAFRSWVRAYATHAAAVKNIFHVRRLHLGHVAHAFALKERPSLVGKSSTKQASQQKRKAQHAPHAQQRHKQPKQQHQQHGGGAGAGGGGGPKQARRQPPQQVASTAGGMYTLT